MKRKGHTGVDTIQRRYWEVYASEYEQLQRRRHTDPDYTIERLRGFLKDAYLRQDNDWLGQGALYDATQGAIVAACEAVLAEWQVELQEQGGKQEAGDEAEAL